jgi:exopolyphosphatase/guanosine-5'-triphosphate,3'-diphosphate pyrophosphatase
MESQLKFAAVDIGSNAVRLLLSGVFEDGDLPTFRKMSLVRMPIRLGDDAFTQKHISENKVSQLVKTIVGFNHLIDAFQPLGFMACATAAMREAENGSQIREQILNESSIDVEIIDGKKEAQIIMVLFGSYTKTIRTNRESFL